MLFPCNALASGPQARFGAKKNLKSEGGQGWNRYCLPMAYYDMNFIWNKSRMA
jgi:hypothetical protein